MGKPYEPCAGCEAYKQQLAVAHAEKREMLETLTMLLKPKVITPNVPVHVVTPASAHEVFSKRREALEREHRLTEQTKVSSPFIARTDSESSVEEKIKSVENALGVNQEGEGTNG